jgi:hypothetical protein
VQRIFIKKCFLFYGGKCLSRKGVHNWDKNRFADDVEVEAEMLKWLRQQRVPTNW